MALDLTDGDLICWTLKGLPRIYKVYGDVRLTPSNYWAFHGLLVEPKEYRSDRYRTLYVRDDLIDCVLPGEPFKFVGDPYVHYQRTKKAQQPFCRLYPYGYMHKLKHSLLAIEVTCEACRLAMEWDEAAKLRKSPLPEGVNPYMHFYNLSKTAKGRITRGFATRRARYYAAKRYWDRQLQCQQLTKP